MDVAAWNELAERSRVLVHHASRLLGALTHPRPARDGSPLAAFATELALALPALVEAMAAAPELAAHERTLRRFESALAAWRASVADASPLEARWRHALLQQAAQAVTTGLHVGALAEGEAARVHVTRRDVGGFASPSSG